LTRTLKDRDKDLEVTTEKLKTAQRNWKDTAAELSKHLSEANPLADDDFFIKAWGDLKYKIIDWSRNHFVGAAQPKLFALGHAQKPPPGERPFRALSDNAHQYLHSDDHRPCIVQSFIWSVLMRKVFTSPGHEGPDPMELKGFCWSGAQRDHLDSLMDFLYPGKTTSNRELIKLTRVYFKDAHEQSDSFLRKYLKWRATTTAMVLAKINNDSDKASVIRRELLDELTGYALKYLQPLQCSTDDASCHRGLEEIILSAIQLDAKMNQQWAIVLPHYTWDEESIRRPYGFSFDHTIMEAINGENADLRQAKVQLVLAPALIRVGTMDGERYNSETKALVKAWVHVSGLSAGKPGAETAADDVENNLLGNQGGFPKRTLRRIKDGLRR
jgi:hypothetical protein